MSRLELLFLHALPLDSSMWAGQMDVLPGATIAPTLYALGGGVVEWAEAALKMVAGDRLIVVGCSVGGSCAIEVARIAPDRVTALVLIGTKAAHRPDPDLLGAALQTIQKGGVEAAWHCYWEPLFSAATDRSIVAAAKRTALGQSPEAVARGVAAFHSRPSRANFLSTFSGRVAVIMGADDIAPGPLTNRAQVEMAPLGRLHVIEGCGHYVPLEKPGEFDRILGDVIAEQS